MEEKSILHCDCNNFFASCECLLHPEYKNVPLVVAGKVEERRGVVLAKNNIAKKLGVKTGMRIFEAQNLCKDLVVCEPNMKFYMQISNKVKQIYLRFSDRVESFSIDECFLDVTHSKIFGSAVEIANKIRELVKQEIGITISAGVSFCKIFAKIGSDLKKPDATTEVSRENYKDVVWKLPVEDMVGVGKHTQEKFGRFGIRTIGDLANFPVSILEHKLGKVGRDLWLYANGEDDREVALCYEKTKEKSVGNSVTFCRDLKTRQEVLQGFELLAESVVKRMIAKNIAKATTIQVTIKDNDLKYFQKRCKLCEPCRSTKIFARTAYSLFVSCFDFKQNVRLLGISVCDFVEDVSQLNFFEPQKPHNEIDNVVDEIQNKFGNKSICKAITLLNKELTNSIDISKFVEEMKIEDK